MPLERAKLNLPQPERDQLVRTRLVTWLNQALARNLILVSAPAGYGKTTLLSQWLAQVAMPAAWVSLDDDDNEPLRFIAYLTAAVQSAFLTSCQETLQVLQLPQPPPMQMVEATLLNDLGEFFAGEARNELILVLDDFDRITNQTTLELLIRLMQNPPRNLHLVLSVRASPRLPLPKWRARGQVLELGAADLRVTRDEAQMVVSQLVGKEVGAQVLDELYARTEGWMVGLRLAALSLESSSNAQAFLTAFRQHGGREVREFLQSEVLAAQSPDVQNFLLNTSILTHVCASLAGALLGDERGDADALLDEVLRANLFLTPLDEQGEWYNYHALFREMLERELHARYSQSEIDTLHRRASEWFAAHAMLDEAVSHALAGHNPERAAQLVEENIYPSLNREDWRALEHGLGLLPEPLIQRRPRLLMARAWTLNEHQRLSAIAPILTRVQELLPAEDESVRRALRGEIAVLHAQNLYLENKNAEGLAAAQSALQALPAEAEYVRSLAVVFCALHLYQLGQLDAARAFCSATIDREAVPTSVSMRALLGLCHIYRQSNRFDDARRAAERMLYVGTQKNFPIAQTWARYVLGSIAYERTELDAAREHFLFVSEQRYRANALCVSDSLIGLGLVYAAQNRWVEADETQQDLHEYATITGSPLYTLAATTLRTRLALQRADATSASRILSEPPAPLTPLWLLLPRALVEARVMVLRPNRAALFETLKRIAVLREFAENTHSEWHLIEIFALRALAYEGLGEKKKALGSVGHAFALAEPAGALRTILDFGAPMAQLVRAYAARNPSGAFVQKLLDAFTDAAASTDPGAQAKPLRRQLGEPLNPRELEILQYLERRYTAPEIADALVISSWTVRTHIRNIYRKLQANNRASAVAKAQALGLLTRA